MSRSVVAAFISFAKNAQGAGGVKKHRYDVPGAVMGAVAAQYADSNRASVHAKNSFSPDPLNSTQLFCEAL